MEYEHDWTEDGKKLIANELYIEKLNQLGVKLYTGTCSCGHQIVRDAVIKFCAYCHKEIKN